MGKCILEVYFFFLEIYKKVVLEWKEKDYVYFEIYSFLVMFD